MKDINLKETLTITQKPLEEQIKYWKREYLDLSKENEQLKAQIDKTLEYINYAINLHIEDKKKDSLTFHDYVIDFLDAVKQILDSKGE